MGGSSFEQRTQASPEKANFKNLASFHYASSDERMPFGGRLKIPYCEIPCKKFNFLQGITFLGGLDMQKFIGIALGLLSILLMAATCGGEPPVPGCPDGKFIDYTIATQVSGELEIGDCGFPDNATASQARVDYYKFTLDKQTDVTFYLQTDIFSPEVAVFNSENVKVISTPFRTATKQLLAGDYVIAVIQRSELGTYTLSTSTPEKGFGGCLTLPKNDLGSSVNGELDITDCFFFNEPSRVEYYEFEVSEQDDITVDLRSSELPFLQWNLYTRGGDQVTVSTSNTGTKQLAPGNYVIAVVGRSGGLGQYKVTTTTTTKGFSGCLTLTDYALGATVNGVIDITDCQAANSASYTDYYILTLSQQQNVSFSVNSPDFSIGSFVGLYERDGTRVKEAIGTISSTQLAAGTYVILVNGRGDLGTYTLTSTVE